MVFIGNPMGRSIMISNVFLDEIDSISCIRGSESSIADQRLTNQLLIERDNINNSQLAVFVIAATNLPWQIDDAAAFSDICSPDEIEVFSQQTDNFLGSDISNINNRVKFMPLHILYICKKIVVSILSGEKSSICVCADPHNTSLGTILEIDFHGVVREYGEHAINIPAIYAVFISDQISFCSPTVSTSSREKYISYSESLFK